jgi:hypothetical protein
MRRNEVVGAINRDITSSTKINGGVITTGTIKADQIGTGKFPVGAINTGELDADNITAGTLTARSVRTNAADAQRVVMSATTNSFRVYNSGGTEVGNVSGGSISGVGLRVANTSDEYLSLYPGVIDLQGDNVGIEIRSSATRSASTITLDAGRISVPKFGTDISTANGYGIITAFNGTALNDGSLRATYVGGTDNGVVQVTSDGVPFRRDMRGSGQRTVVASATGFLSAPTSDERLKKDIQPLDVGLTFIDKLNPKKFAFKSEPGMVEYGLIAQEVRHAIAELGIKDNTNLVFEDNSDYKLAELPEGESGPVLGIEYIKLIPILINSVKELKARVEFLENQIDGEN